MHAKVNLTIIIPIIVEFIIFSMLCVVACQLQEGT